MTDREIYINIAESKGISNHFMDTIKDCSKLIGELSCWLRGEERNIIGEIADIEIRIGILRMLFDEYKIDNVKREKLLRLQKRLGNGKQP